MEAMPSEALMDLRSLKGQLHSAAEWFELCYGDKDKKQITLDPLKNFVAKAVGIAAEKMGCVACEVENTCEQNSNDCSILEMQFGSLEQRMKLCEEFGYNNGVSEQALRLKYPKHHRRYVVAEDGYSVNGTAPREATGIGWDLRETMKLGEIEKRDRERFSPAFCGSFGPPKSLNSKRKLFRWKEH